MTMAKPIEMTPVLKGKDARDFRARMDAVVVTDERLAWLRTVAEESKRVEKSAK